MSRSERKFYHVLQAETVAESLTGGEPEKVWREVQVLADWQAVRQWVKRRGQRVYVVETVWGEIVVWGLFGHDAAKMWEPQAGPDGRGAWSDVAMEGRRLVRLGEYAWSKHEDERQERQARLDEERAERERRQGWEETVRQVVMKLVEAQRAGSGVGAVERLERKVDLLLLLVIEAGAYGSVDLEVELEVLAGKGGDMGN